MLGGGVADVGERTRPGDDGEHGDRQRIRGREQAAPRAHEPSGRPGRPGRPGGPSPPRPGFAPLPPCPSGTAPVNAESFTPGCLLNARPTLARRRLPCRRRRGSRAPLAGGRHSLHLQKSGFQGFFHLQARNQVPEGQNLPTVTGGSCTWRVPFVYLRYTWGRLSAGPGARCRDRAYMAARRCTWPLRGHSSGSWPFAVIPLVSPAPHVGTQAPVPQRVSMLRPRTAHLQS